MDELYGQIGRLTTPFAWLKKNLAANLARAERLALLEREQPELSLTTQCALLSLNRTSLYYQPVPPSAEELTLKRRIDELYTAYPVYGWRKTLAPERKCRCRGSLGAPPQAGAAAHARDGPGRHHSQPTYHSPHAPARE